MLLGLKRRHNRQKVEIAMPNPKVLKPRFAKPVLMRLQTIDGHHIANRARFLLDLSPRVALPMLELMVELTD